MAVSAKRWISVVAVALFFGGVFCAGFLFFYHRIQRSKAESAAAVAASKSLIDKPLPHARIIDINGAKVDEQILRRGRVVLVFITTDCDACATESKFLQTLLDRRKDITFYGLVPFGPRPDSDKTFPFKVFFDEDDSFVRSLGINRVPVKVFLEDGIIKNGWIGADVSDKAKTSFIQWMDGLP